MNLAQKIKLLRSEKDWTQYDLAQNSGVSLQSIKMYEAGKNKGITTTILKKIANALNVNVEFFLDSEFGSPISSPISSSKNKKLSSIVRQSPNLSPSKPLNAPNLKKSQDTINIPYFEDTYASAGSGIINYDETPIIMSFDINFLRVFLKITGSLNNLHIINAKGDSMEPTISGGELLYINPYENEQGVISGCIYVINYDGDIFVKRVDKNPVTKSLTLISDNPKYEPIKIEVADLTNCKIIGRVVAHTSRI
ncbi:DNA-binding protein [Campylobacter hyointestinalis]|uniref:XRE family transcriptional regulator n=1 Tax=Campylobacter hyointestinalis TaxID=198 RepID=UPI0007C8F979|nr:LexA family transcriptional regulator [Campylobacter hyointestinalis]ANE31925.1 putative transcriptional regulator, XRE family (peptidase S24 LexA-like domain) [Campylobacter hyointestinalis subsp. hyointestinalis LMG 9260]QKF55090.1 peptidase S24 LexA-like protein [Campylobacter hyointestinalis subsp. hyointestinalis]TXK46309.1 helix-turn-helix domain-containing protein [Campylobacter hyointestinalis]SFT52347.1 Phage repressor protein C, contains Cro/C1-type HTH and peptisase s24 domains [C